MEQWIEQLSLIAGLHAFMCPSCLELTELDERELRTLAGLALRCERCGEQALVPDRDHEYDDAACLRFLPSNSK